MKRFLKKYLELLKGRDRGTVMISFLVSLPILLLVIGIITQYTLLVNARLTVELAAASTARTAMTALPTDAAIDQMDGVNFVMRTVRLALEPISPEATTGASQEANEVGAALRNLGVSVPSTFEARYTTAENATVTSVDIQQLDANGVATGAVIPLSDVNTQDFAEVRGGRKIESTLHFRYYLGVPVIGRLMGTSDDSLGMNYVTFNSSVVVQMAPGREAVSDGTGWAQ